MHLNICLKIPIPYIRDSQGMNPIANSWDPPPIWVCMLLALSCPTLCNPMDCSPPGSSVHVILQARILEWVAIPFSRRSSWPKGWTWASHVACKFLTFWATGEALTLDWAADQRWLHLFGTKKWTLSSTVISLGHLTPSDTQILKLVSSRMVENWNELLKRWRAKGISQLCLHN